MQDNTKLLTQMIEDANTPDPWQEVVGPYYADDLPESAEQLVGVPIVQAGKLVAVNQAQQDQLATFVATLGAPAPDGQTIVPAADNGSHVHAPINKFNGFDIEDGEDLAMLMLHPARGADPAATVPQIKLRIRNSDWDQWLRKAVTIGLTNGEVLGPDGEMFKGFAVMVEHPQTGARVRMAFTFKQVAAILPFRDLELTARRLEAKSDEAMAKKKQQQLKKRRSKIAAKSRKTNK